MTPAQKRETEFRNIWEEASIAANKAGNDTQPQPMTVYTPTSMFNDTQKPGTRAEVVDDGVCGFAWINISGRGGFAKFTKEHNYSSKSVYKGRNIWATALYNYNGQSYERKMKAVSAAVQVFNKYGIKAYAEGRLD